VKQNLNLHGLLASAGCILSMLALFLSLRIKSFLHVNNKLVYELIKNLSS